MITAILDSLTNSKWISIVLVSFLWGGTNPLIKLGYEKYEKAMNEMCIDEEKNNNINKKFFNQLIFYPAYALPLALNLSGSLVYYAFCLRFGELKSIVPIVNSLSFVWTEIVEELLLAVSATVTAENRQNMLKFVGMLLVISGVWICH